MRLTMWLVWVLMILELAGCEADSEKPDREPNGDHEAEVLSDGDLEFDGDTEWENDEAPLDPNVPEDIPALPTALPFAFQRPDNSTPPSRDEIVSFTRDFTAFFKESGYFTWLSRYSQGLPDDNDSGMPGYKVWWTNAYAGKHDGLVTISWERPSDNSTAKVGRALPPLIGLTLASNLKPAYELALGYINGLSANYDGMIWAGENPVVDKIMARCIFQKNYQRELDGGRRIAVDYDSVRYEIVERRHDTLHNPDNPSYGDIYVRNKRSKDDFPYLYRDAFWLVHLIWRTGENDVRDAAIKLFRQIRGMAEDIVEHDYAVRTKDGNGNPYMPVTESGGVDDFASFSTYDFLFPLAECNAKLATAYLASGEKLANECIDDDSEFYGDGGGYEDIAISSHFWASNMIWGYHVTALAMALTFGDFDTAHKLLDGLATRIDGLMVDARSEYYTEWITDLVQLLVLAAAYGLPLTGDEAHLIQTQYLEAAEFYKTTVVWDPWAADAPDDTAFPILPDRNVYNDVDEVTKTHVRITEILNPFEYCASPLRNESGAQFVDCEVLLDPDRWAGNR